jgi:hypothetical protein
MSHNVTVDSIKITDIDALRDAASELQNKGINISIEENAYARSYNTATSGNYPVVVKLHDSPYDIGLRAGENGTYSPVFDPFASHIKNQIGIKDNVLGELVGDACSLNDPKVHIGQLMQMYGVCKAEREAATQGLSVQRSYDEATKQYDLVIAGY